LGDSQPHCWHTNLVCVFADTNFSYGNVQGDILRFYPSKLETNNNTLLFRSCEIFTTTSSLKNQLNGFWRSELCETGIEKFEGKWQKVEGKIHNIYHFEKDSLYTYSYYKTYNSNIPVGKDIGNYTFDSSILRLYSFGWNFRFYFIQVTFQNDHMYWEYFIDYSNELNTTALNKKNGNKELIIQQGPNCKRTRFLTDL